MKVAYLVNQYPRTSHSFIRREIQAVEASGCEVLRFSIRPLTDPLPTEADRLEAERTRMILDAGVTGLLLGVASACIRHPRRMARALSLAVRLGWRSERGLPRHLAYLAEAAVLARDLQDAGVDHLHAHFGTNSAAVALLCSALSGIPYSFTVHGSEEFDKPEAIGLRLKVEQARFVVAISNFGRAQLWRWVREEDWDKVHVVRCGLDEAILRHGSTPVPSDPRLVCVARLIPGKGHLLLVEAVARLVAEGVPVEVLLAGDGPFRKRVEEAIRAHGLEDRIRIGGWMSADQVRDAILASRAMVLPSFSEGLPVVVMEALALRRPVVTTTVAGIPELVEEGVSGWLVPAGSVDALVPAMREALQASPDRLQQMGDHGARAVARFHDAAAEARALVALFRSEATTAGEREVKR